MAESDSGYGGGSESEIGRLLLLNIRDCYLKSKEINYNMLFILTNPSVKLDKHIFIYENFYVLVRMLSG
jgi:hypothetical protein